MTSIDLIRQQLHSYMIGNLRSDLMLNRGENDNPEDKLLKQTLVALAAYCSKISVFTFHRKMVIGGCT